TSQYKAAANWMIGPIRGFLNDKAVSIDEFPITAKAIAQIIQLIDDGKLSFAIANQRLFGALLESPETHPEELAKSLNLIQVGDDDFLQKLIDEVIAQFPDKVAEYKSGKTGLLGMFMGQIMKKSQGKADPKKTNQLLAQALDND
ncbi:MAG: Asp-tRNA(Asn)/Glu-tRNA(Gln) amidotransferase GatCAB subunit B, partial [Bacteroidetes bacterium]|nr:Asp-tRNA(Asn)/Glu-tRNA(Gln) amidotransferase GatCAB subunit B [Bacteroidota bacterium]